MSQEGANIVYGASATLAFLTAGALDAHTRGMEAVRAAREESVIDQWHAHYAAELAEQAAEIAALRAELENQRTKASVLSGLWKKATSENEALKASVGRKNDLLQKMTSVIEKLRAA